tara:strand:- start:223 stop:894 length:672 start_codon:yes stop_codon:yes gene_type:complete
MSNNISLIIPAKNEVESLEAVLSEIQENKLVDEIIVVVDNINDNSVETVNKFNCKLIIQKNNGYGAAIIEGFKHAKNKFGCIFNADHSFDPKYLDALTKESTKNDFIFGTRYNKESGSDDDTIVTFIGNKIFTFICNKILKIKISDVLFTYVLCNVEKFNKLSLKNHDFKLCIELPAKVKQNNFSYSEVPIFERKRYGGKKKVNALKDGFLILIEIIKNIQIR